MRESIAFGGYVGEEYLYVCHETESLRYNVAHKGTAKLCINI